MPDIPADFTADIDRVPVGLSGAHRDRYLSLDPQQRRTYRYHYDVCGRLAAHCYKLAAGGVAARFDQRHGNVNLVPWQSGHSAR